MKNKNTEKLRKKFIDLYLNKNMNIKQISEKTGHSRQYISNLINDNKDIIKKKNTKIISIYKYKNPNKMNVYIPVSFLKSIGISSNINEKEQVEVSLQNNKIIIEKHEK